MCDTESVDKLFFHYYALLTMPLSFTSLTSALQITRTDADQLLVTAAAMEAAIKKNGGTDIATGKVLAALFYEPSTRTRLSFETAMLRLGGKVISAEGVEFSSISKGETIEDTIRVVGGYADIIAMRHPQVGSADRAAAVSFVPFINAGDGPGQHPTQALLDLYTIQKERGGIEGVHIAMVGDLKFGRTVHSLTQLLSLFPSVRFTFVAPAQLPMPEKVTQILKEKKIAYTETTDLQEGLKADVLYMTRVQKERFDDTAEYERLKLSYVLTADLLQGKHCTVMHPLPRVGEITEDIDALPTAAFFREAHNGVPMRMALIAHLLRLV